jgi:hypothetical protein
MNIQNIRVLFAAQYAAPYLGNFMRSLILLEEQIKKRYHGECAYALPKAAAEQSWAAEFETNHKVYYTGEEHQLINSAEAEEIVADFKPSIVHTHFEGYDVPMYNAIQKIDKNIREVWHMHDHLSLHPHPLKAILVARAHFKHYGKPVIHSVLRGG